MSNGIRSLPRYQEGGPHRPPSLAKYGPLLRRALEKMAAAGNMNAAKQLEELASSDEVVFQALEGAIPLTADEEKLLSRGLGSLPQEPSWTRELGIPERAAFPMPSAEDFARLSPREQRALLNLRDFDRMAETRAAILETPPRNPGFSAQRVADVREQFTRRNPSAPIGWEYGAPTIEMGYTASEVREHGGMTPIPPEKRPGSYESYFPDVEGGMGRGEIEDVLFEIMDADITEQEIAQALDDPMFGGPLSGTASNAEIDERVYGRRYADRMEQKAADEAWRERGVSIRDRSPGFPDEPTSPKTPARRGISGLRHRAGQAVRGAGITALKAIRNRLPAMVAATAATAAASHPVSALADVALSPTELGLGELSEESRFSPEEKVKYYDELMNLGRELGVGRHRPSILQLSREINGPSIRSSYPMGR